MNQYRATRVITLHSGRVSMSEEQAARRVRTGKLRKDDDGYEIVGAMQIKAGEAFGYNGDLAKSMIDDVEEVVEEVAEKKSAKKAKDDASGNQPE